MQSNLTGIVLLAAGASRRMGRTKQLLEFQEQTFLRRSAETALQISGKVVVTLGARSEILRREIEDLPVQIAENVNWKSGMGGSLKIGLETLFEKDKLLKSAIVIVCDQPFVEAKLLEKLLEEFDKTNAPVIACEYADTLGVPALFAAKMFPELLALADSRGAKHLIEKYRNEVVSVPFPEGAFDVDTPEDYEKLLKRFT